MPRTPGRAELKALLAALRHRPGRAGAVAAAWCRALGLRWRLPAPVPPPVRLAPPETLERWRGAPSPRVSIVVPVYNQVDTTMECLRSVVGAAAGTDLIELVVVDDASVEAGIERIAGLPGIRYHRNAANQGFVASCNAGAQLARGEYLVFLNSDTLVPPGWLEPLLEALQRTGVGMAGACLVYPDGTLQEAGGLVYADAGGWNYGRGGHPGDPRYRTWREADYCSGAAIAIRRDRFAGLGGFDPAFAPGYYEDTDLAMRVRGAGERVLYVAGSRVVHLEGASAGTDPKRGMKAYQAVNRERFRERWGATLDRGHPAPGTDADLAVRLRGAGWVVACMGDGAGAGAGGGDLPGLLGTLAERGCAVDLVLCAPLDPTQADALRRCGVWVWDAPWEAGARWLLARHGAAVAALLDDGSAPAAEWLRRARPDAPGAVRLRLGGPVRPGAPVEGARPMPVGSADDVLAVLA